MKCLFYTQNKFMICIYWIKLHLILAILRDKREGSGNRRRAAAETSQKISRCAAETPNKCGSPFFFFLPYPVRTFPIRSSFEQLLRMTHLSIPLRVLYMLYVPNVLSFNTFGKWIYSRIVLVIRYILFACTISCTRMGFINKCQFTIFYESPSSYTATATSHYWLTSLSLHSLLHKY